MDKLSTPPVNREGNEEDNNKDQVKTPENPAMKKLGDATGRPSSSNSEDNNLECAVDKLSTPPVNREGNEEDNNKNQVKIPETPTMKKLGYGTGVAVYRFTRPSNLDSYVSPWAIKKIKRLKGVSPTEFDKRIQYEAEILETLCHPNIVGYRGLGRTLDGYSCLAMEECDVSLADLIEQRLENNLGPFPASIVAKVALDVATALHYLHTTRLLLHGDIKSANVLIKYDFDSVKLCDFGVCLPLRPDGTFDEDNASPVASCYVGTDCWSAPEVLGKTDKPITSKTDIFSYGLLIWEMLTLQPPHISNLDDDSESSFDEGAYQNRIGTRPPLPPLEDEYRHLVTLFEGCTDVDPDKRLSAEDVVLLLQVELTIELNKQIEEDPETDES